MKNEFIGDITYKDYDKIPAVRSTFLKKIIHCPRNIFKKENDTWDLFFGRAVHDALLRPDTFNDLYTIAKPCHERFQSGKREGKFCKADGKAYDGHTFWFCEKHRGRYKLHKGFLLQNKNMEDIHGMINSIMEHPTAADLFQLGGKAEQAITWKDPETNIWCKAMSDWLPGFGNIETNIKTTSSCDNWSFYRQNKDLYYYMSSAMAMEGLSIVTGQQYNIANYIVVEKKWPYKVSVYELPEEGLTVSRKRGNELFHECLRKYKSCLEKQTKLMQEGMPEEQASRKAFPAYESEGCPTLGEHYFKPEMY